MPLGAFSSLNNFFSVVLKSAKFLIRQEKNVIRRQDLVEKIYLRSSHKSINIWKKIIWICISFYLYYLFLYHLFYLYHLYLHLSISIISITYIYLYLYIHIFSKSSWRTCLYPCSHWWGQHKAALKCSARTVNSKLCLN